MYYYEWEGFAVSNIKEGDTCPLCHKRKVSKHISTSSFAPYILRCECGFRYDGVD